MKTLSEILIKKQFDRAWNKYAVLPVICLAAFLCCGCGKTEPQRSLPDSEARETVNETSMESTAVVDYVTPQLVPNVMVNLVGYQADGSKLAVVKGRRLPKVYHLTEADTGRVVFTGGIEEAQYNAEADLYTAYADFSGWTQEGSYYLECEYIGRSCSFRVEQRLYERMFAEICGELFEQCRERTIPLADAAELLLAYEWYPDIFPDESGNQIPDVLDQIAAWIAAAADDPIESGREDLYAATLAKFSYLYQKFDRQYATDCLKRSSVVFEQTQGTLQNDAECFYALTELYRATGLPAYNNQIEEYKTYFENHADFTEEPGYLYGAMTYIATRQPVNVKLCAFFMSSMMAEGEEISNVYEEMIHPVNSRNNGAKDLLRHAMDVACANYVLNNPQYNQIMEEFMHYLRGRNRQSVDFYADEADGSQPYEGYLLLLAQITAVQEILNK